ncbi:ankyrin repeat domain-containing protein [Criblamydia sequanensis]|uniref:Ankyrin repeat-containing protein n=1 Tax=Candidatus Criblamydia sequanensis CRIB-18 TaxID=1437425 RepID=A0A090D376_9BACT|nr:ankyrin repeat domain-containing protein [Criblamydia sequanensis]CDR35023.1 Ankyrin repeat-containing protein [Criblamydia sequanensis CRIB-18]
MQSASNRPLVPVILKTNLTPLFTPKQTSLSHRLPTSLGGRIHSSFFTESNLSTTHTFTRKNSQDSSLRKIILALSVGTVVGSKALSQSRFYSEKLHADKKNIYERLSETLGVTAQKLAKSPETYFSLIYKQIELGNLDVVKDCLEIGMDPFYNPYEFTKKLDILLYAIFLGKLEIVQYLLEETPYNINCSYVFYMPYAEGYGEFKDSVPMTIVGTHPFQARFFDCVTPVYMAVLANKPEILKLLTENGADCNLKNISGNHRSLNPFICAIEKGHKECFDILLKRGNIDVNCKCRARTPLELAIKKNNLPMIEDLLNAGAKLPPEIKDVKDARAILAFYTRKESMII